MRTIEATVVVTDERRIALDVPADIAPGTHRLVVVIEEEPVEKAERPPLDFPVHDVGPWPEGLSLRREDMYDDWGR